MNLTFSEEQVQIKTVAREFFESEGIFEMVTEQPSDPHEVLDEVWSTVGEIEHTAVTVPLEYGGFGEGMFFATLVLEEAGRVAFPGPLPDTVAFAAPLINELGSDELKAEYLPAIASGDVSMSFAVYEDRRRDIPDGIELEAVETDEGFRLNGQKSLVPFAEQVDRIIVPARTENDSGFDGITLFLIDPADTATKRIKSLDGTRPLYDAKFDDVFVPARSQLGSLHEGGPGLERAMDRFLVATCAMMVGGAERVVEMSAEFAKERVQFGHPIGRFQAVKHRIVDMWMDVEASRSLVYYAALALDSGDTDAQRAVSAAKAYCGDRIPWLIRDDIQNHGAMGITLDHDAHVFLKQAKAWQNYLGSPEDHLERVAICRDL